MFGAMSLVLIAAGFVLVSSIQVMSDSKTAKEKSDIINEWLSDAPADSKMTSSASRASTVKAAFRGMELEEYSRFLNTINSDLAARVTHIFLAPAHLNTPHIIAQFRFAFPNAEASVFGADVGFPGDRKQPPKPKTTSFAAVYLEPLWDCQVRSKAPVLSVDKYNPIWESISSSQFQLIMACLPVSAEAPLAEIGRRTAEELTRDCQLLARCRLIPGRHLTRSQVCAFYVYLFTQATTTATHKRATVSISQLQPLSSSSAAVPAPEK